MKKAILFTLLLAGLQSNAQAACTSSQIQCAPKEAGDSFLIRTTTCSGPFQRTSKSIMLYRLNSKHRVLAQTDLLPPVTYAPETGDITYNEAGTNENSSENSDEYIVIQIQKMKAVLIDIKTPSVPGLSTDTPISNLDCK